MVTPREVENHVHVVAGVLGGVCGALFLGLVIVVFLLVQLRMRYLKLEEMCVHSWNSSRLNEPQLLRNDNQTALQENPPQLGHQDSMYDQRFSYQPPTRSAKPTQPKPSQPHNYNQHPTGAGHAESFFNRELKNQIQLRNRERDAEWDQDVLEMPSGNIRNNRNGNNVGHIRESMPSAAEKPYPLLQRSGNAGGPSTSFTANLQRVGY